MKDFAGRHGPFLIALVAFLVGGILVWAWVQPAPAVPTMSAKEVRARTQQAATAQAQAANHSAAADATAARAASPYAAAKAAETTAILYRAQSHAPLRPAADTTAERLQRLLTTYGLPAH